MIENTDSNRKKPSNTLYYYLGPEKILHTINMTVGSNFSYCHEHGIRHAMYSICTLRLSISFGYGHSTLALCLSLATLVKMFLGPGKFMTPAVVVIRSCYMLSYAVV